MSVRVRETSSPAGAFPPALSRAEAADAARRRLIDTATRVDADRRRGRGAYGAAWDRTPPPAVAESGKGNWNQEPELSVAVA